VSGRGAVWGQMLMIGVGLIGYGYWGPSLVRNFFEADGCQVSLISDLSRDRLARAAARYPSVRTTANHTPNVQATEALQTEVQHLLHCIEHKQRPTTDGAAGLRVVRTLEAASQSMKQRGRPKLALAKGATAWSRS
jgi:predicted dehydrogenase